MVNRVVIAALLTISIFAPPASANQFSDCNIPVTDASIHQSVGWPRDPDIMSSIGESKILVLPVDFPDAQSDSTSIGDLERRMELRNVAIFYDVVSGGKLQTIFDVKKEIVRVNNESNNYGGFNERDVFRDGDFLSHVLTRDALLAYQSANPKSDLSQYSAAIIVVTSGKSLSGRVALAHANNKDAYGLLPGGINNSILVGLGSLSVPDVHPGRMFVHEINHLLGIPDLYLYEADGYWQGKSPGPFGQQGYIRGIPSSDSMAYNRWLRGWIPDDRVLCFPSISSTQSFTLSPRGSTTGQYEMALYRVSENVVLAFESPKELGFGSKTFPRTILVYTVDSGIKPGDGPIRLVPKRDPITMAPLSSELPDWERYKTAALKAGEFVEYGSFVIVNSTKESTGNRVSATILVGGDAVKKTITCIKKSKKIKVSGYLPNCPLGYKKL